MSTLRIELNCPYEVYESEWLEIVAEINAKILSGKYDNVSAHIVSGLTPRAADECHTCGATASFLDDVCIECGTRR